MLVVVGGRRLVFGAAGGQVGGKARKKAKKKSTRTMQTSTKDEKCLPNQEIRSMFFAGVRP